MAGRRELTDPKTLSLETEVLKNVEPEVQEILLGFIGRVVNSMPEETGLKLFDDLRAIAAACYKCEWGDRPNRLH